MNIAQVSELNTRSHTELCMYTAQGNSDLIELEDIPIFVGMRHCIRRLISNTGGLLVDISTCRQSCEHFEVCHPIPLDTPEAKGVEVILPKIEP